MRKNQYESLKNCVFYSLVKCLNRINSELIKKKMLAKGLEMFIIDCKNNLI